jgi:hypothetical protein
VQVWLQTCTAVPQVTDHPHCPDKALAGSHDRDSRSWIPIVNEKLCWLVGIPLSIRAICSPAKRRERRPQRVK